MELIEIVKIKDRFLLITLSSTLAAIPGMITLHLLNFFTDQRYINMPLISLEVFLEVQPLNLTKIILGIAATFVISGMYGVFYVVSLDLTGWRDLWLKALVVCFAGWFLFGHGVMRLLNIGAVYRDQPLSILIFLIAHLFYGTYLFFAVKKFGVPK